MAVQIPVYRRREAIDPGLATSSKRARVIGAPGIGPALEVAARELGATAEVLERRRLQDEREQARLAAEVERQQERDGAVWAGEQISRFRVARTEKFIGATEQAEEGAPNFAAERLADFDRDADALLQQAPTDAARRFMKSRLDAVRDDEGVRALTFESGQRRAQRGAQIERAVDNVARVASADPVQFVPAMGELRAMLDMVDAPPSEKAAAWDKAKQRVAYAAAVSEAERNPRAFVKMADGKEHPAWWGEVDAENRQRVLIRARNEVERLDRQAQLEADRREARAERAIATAHRQLASGVPLTAEAWSALNRATQGTSVAAEFGELVRSENEIQQVLREPIDKQVAFVQGKRAELLQKGGTLQEQANIDRLARAVQSNVQTLQQEPLQWAANRAGAQPAPLDVQALTQPDQAPAARAEIQRRVETVRALQRQYGTVVPTRVLQPAEAKALAGALNNAAPQQQAQVFAHVNDLAGGDAGVYQSMMQQIAPDSPVRALAGMIAGKQTEVTVQDNWITSDVVRSAGDVAATILRGEAIINPPAAQKKDDGKPAGPSLFAPPRADFDAELVRYVGQAFANRPEALQTAQQAAYAYYVGKAVQTGTVMGKDTRAVDPKLAREALVATLGEPVERNGSTVFAPWGMSRDEFEPKARDAFRAEVARRGLPSKLADDRWPVLSLKQATGDTYYVTMGQQLMLDAKNEPIVIQVRPRSRSAVQMDPLYGDVPR